ncbi:hypothetical protein [Rhodopila sp.]|uniref:hypothetical protein n=1 Tax=Rhodopila sp. TaxID=2480087 RepID=UPI003D1015C2
MQGKRDLGINAEYDAITWVVAMQDDELIDAFSAARSICIRQHTAPPDAPSTVMRLHRRFAARGDNQNVIRVPLRASARASRFTVVFCLQVRDNAGLRRSA